MRVLTFLHSFEPGGVERVALRLVARWRTMGIDAPLFIGRDTGALRDELASGLEYEVPRQPKLGTAWWETLWMIVSLPRCIRRERPDAIFCAGNTYTIVALAMKLRFGRRCPPIIAKISNDLVRADLPAPARSLWHGWLKLQARFIDRWIVMDAAILHDVTAHLGRVPRTVIPDPAIDHLPLKNAPRTNRMGTRFLSVGRLVAQKDPGALIAAFARAASPEDLLSIIGDGPLASRLRRQAENLGIAERVRFLGHVPNAAEAMREHDVLLLSSKYEGVPAVLIEALAARLGIVATDCGSGVRSILDDGRLGALVPQGNLEAFAEAIVAAGTLVVDADAGRRQAHRFTIDDAARRYLEAIHRTAARGDLGRLAFFEPQMENAA